MDDTNALLYDVFAFVWFFTFGSISLQAACGKIGADDGNQGHTVHESRYASVWWRVAKASASSGGCSLAAEPCPARDAQACAIEVSATETASPRFASMT
jgi:hypothetical protein